MEVVTVQDWERSRSRRVDNEVRLVRVYALELDQLMRYIEALYEHDDHHDAMVNIKQGVESLMRNEALANAYFIKRKEDKIGYVLLTRYHSVKKGGVTIYIDELYVEPQHRRKGIGKHIMAEILEIARGENARTVWAQTELFNEAAQGFFRTQGFREVPSKFFELPI